MFLFFFSSFNFYMFSYMNHGKNHFSFSINLGFMIDYFMIFFNLIYLIFFNFYFCFVLF